MCTHLNFDYKKATQALNFFAQKESGKINKMKALKLIFLADRYHLRKYGRPITNDEYFAMDLGPVASGVKDIAESSDFLSNNVKSYSSDYLKLSMDRNYLESISPLNDMVFSDSDIEALNFAWDEFGCIEEFKLSKITHKYPEWKKHEEALKVSSRVRMKIEDFFNDPDSTVNKCFELTKEEKLDRIEHLDEIAKIEALWD